MPAVAHTTKLYAVKDAKLTPMTADPAGGTATYGTAIDVPGIKSVAIGGRVKTVELHGDHTLLDSDNVLEVITVTFNYAKESMALRAAALGGTVTDTGTTPNQIAKWRLLATDAMFPYFKFEASPAGVDLGIGDGHIVLYKCKINDFPQLGLAEDDYQTFSVPGFAIPRQADNVWIDVILNETASAIV